MFQKNSDVVSHCLGADLPPLSFVLFILSRSLPFFSSLGITARCTRTASRSSPHSPPRRVATQRLEVRQPRVASVARRLLQPVAVHPQASVPRVLPVRVLQARRQRVLQAKGRLLLHRRRRRILIRPWTSTVRRARRVWMRCWTSTPRVVVLKRARTRQRQ